MEGFPIDVIKYSKGSVSDLEEMLLKHKTYEEKNVYPVLDLEISEGEKRYMIERIKEVRL